MKRLFITGISGFIGQALWERLRNRYDIVGLYHSVDRCVIPSCYGVDLLDFSAVRGLLEDAKPDIVIHLAARTEVEKSFYEPVEFSSINYIGTVNLIEQSRQVLPDLELFLFSSTMETYGYQEVWEPFNEETLQNPNAPYAVAKMACEKYLEYAGRAYNFPYCILRQTNTYGRIDNDFFVVEQIITQMLKNPNEINLGYAEPYRNFLFIDDLLSLYETVLDSVDKSSRQVFCTGPPNAIKIADLVYKIADMIGWKGKVNWNTKPERVGEIYYLNSVYDKAYSILGWKPIVDLDKGLEWTIAHWRGQLYA